jgi:hypothetical protein
MFLCLLWIILLSIALFAQWDVMNHTERQLFTGLSCGKSQILILGSLMFVILVVDSFTVIMLPIL